MLFRSIINLSFKSIVVIVPSLDHVPHKHGKSSNTSICTERCKVTSRIGDTYSMRDKGDVGDKVEAIQNVLEEWVVCLSNFVSYLENCFVLFMPTSETFKKTIHKVHIQ